MNLELDAPNVGELEKKYLNDVVDKGFVSTFGPFIPEFEKKIREYLGVQGAVGLQSGTAAIYMALRELGIGPGDEVIVPALTFTATVNPVLYLGATPVIVDVDKETWNLAPARVKQAINDKTKAIIPVHLYGIPCDMTAIMKIAQEHDLYVVEDATESLGAAFKDKPMGTFGNFGVLSFNGNKLITTGGGGMVIGEDVERIEHIRYLANQAKDDDQPSFHSEMGFNYRMTNIEAALGLAQFEQLEAFLAKKRKFDAIYREAFAGLNEVRFQDSYDDSEKSSWFTCITVDKRIDILDLIEKLKIRKVPTRRVFMPLNEMPYLEQFVTPCPNAYEIYDCGLCLPGSTLNDEKDIEKAALVIKEVLNG